MFHVSFHFIWSYTEIDLILFAVSYQLHAEQTNCMMGTTHVVVGLAIVRRNLYCSDGNRQSQWSETKTYSITLLTLTIFSACKFLVFINEKFFFIKTWPRKNPQKSNRLFPRQKKWWKCERKWRRFAQPTNFSLMNFQ